MEPCFKSNWKHRYESLNTKNSRFKRNNISNILEIARWGSYVLLQFFFTWFSASESYRVLIIDITNILVNFVPFVGIIEIWKLKKFYLLTPKWSWDIAIWNLGKIHCDQNLPFWILAFFNHFWSKQRTYQAEKIA